MAKQKFDVTDFNGIVQFHGWQPMPDGRQYMGVAGKISILKDEEIVGFKVEGGQTANWVARVQGPSGSVNVLGCQIKMIHQFDGEIPADSHREYTYYLVP